MYIDYKQQPSNTTCGQTCIAMIMWRPVNEICELMGKKGGTHTKDMVMALNHFQLKNSEKLIRMSKSRSLPSFCIVKLAHRKVSDTHWAIYHNGVYYDPTVGMVTSYDENIRILSYLEIYQEPIIDYREHGH